MGEVKVRLVGPGLGSLAEHRSPDRGLHGSPLAERYISEDRLVRESIRSYNDVLNYSLKEGPRERSKGVSWRLTDILSAYNAGLFV